MLHWITYFCSFQCSQICLDIATHCHKTNELHSHTKEKINNDPDKLGISCCSGEAFWKVRHGFDKILRVLQDAEMPQWMWLCVIQLRR